MAYTSIDSIKHVVGIPSGDTLDDHGIEMALAAADEAIDRYCARKFSVPTETTTVTLVVENGSVLRVPDIASLTGLSISVEASPGVFTAISTTDVVAMPADAPHRDEPYTSLVFRSQRFAVGSLIRVTARFGWVAVPAAVKQASLLLATRLLKRKDSPLGIQSAPDMGMIRVSRVDPDVATLLDPLRRYDATGMAL